ncbi:MAG: putative transposase [Thermotogaceae bacterium]|nr:putative transposase [Thermotogaceae bacterium]
MAGKGKRNIQNAVFGVIRQRLSSLSRKEYEALYSMCRISKNLYNQTLYNIRQHYFQFGSYLRYEENYHMLKSSENYKFLNSNMAQQIIKKAHANFETFFSLLKQAKDKNLPRPSTPKYLPKDGLYPLHIVMFSIKDGYLTIPVSIQGKGVFEPIKIKVPKIVLGFDVKEIKIIPKANGKWFEVQYVYRIKEKEEKKEQPKKVLSVDLGINNFATCVSSDGKAFIMDGKDIKSANQWFNKEMARLRSVYAKQGIKSSERLAVLLEKRQNQIRDYMHKTAKLIVDFCLKEGINLIVVGDCSSIYDKPELGRVNNQNMKFLPLGYLRDLIRHKCEKYEIGYVEVNEAYTSKADSLSKDCIPKHYEKEDFKFSGKRISRGLYLSSIGKVINADVNGAINIMRKAGFEPEFSHVPVPRRIKVWRSVLNRAYAVAGECEPPSKDKAGIDLQTP